MNYLLLFGGLTLILLAADGLVKGAAAVAKRLQVSDLVIGLTIVAFGTSSPELVTNVMAAVNGSTELAIGNIIGSNIANILLIVGLSALIHPLHVHHGTAWKEIPLALLASLILLIVANDAWLDGSTTNFISRSDGLVLLAFFVIFLVYTFEIAKKKTNEDVETIQRMPTQLSILLIIGGLLGLYLGGKWFVEGATNVARSLGVSERVIGLTIVSVGTSLPELFTSLVAAYRKKADIAVGNVVGSNIFNIFMILGVTAIIHPLPFDCVHSNFDAWVSVAASAALFFSTRLFTKNQVGHLEGSIFAAVYVAYIIFLIFF